jgi:hypothetical protein
MRASKFFFALVCLVAIPNASMAATITYNATLSGVQYAFGGVNSFTSTQFSLGGPAPKMNFTLTGGDQFEIVLSAPAGKQFNLLAPPANVIAPVLMLEFWSAGAVILPLQSEPGDSFILAGDPGPAPAVSEFAFEWDINETIAPKLTVQASPRSFTSLTAVFNVPGTYSRTFTDVDPAIVRLSVLGFVVTDDDPGPLGSITPIRMSDVPEPSTLALVGGALGALVLLYRRRAA